MPHFAKRLSECMVITWGLLLVPAMVGCHGFSHGALPDLALQPQDAKAANKEIASANADGKSPASTVSTADRAVLSRSVDKDSKSRAHSVWIHAVDPAADFRWRYPNLDDILARPAKNQPDFHLLLSDSDPIISTNAAIALARTGDGIAKERLVEAARSPELPLPMRCAAVEALANLQNPQAVELLKNLLNQYGRFGKAIKTPYVPELHAELIRGLARQVDPADESQFITALRSPHANVRLEALKAWAKSRKSDLPIEALDLRTDGDYRIRSAAIEAIAAKQHPQAFEYLSSGLMDTDVQVRHAAIGALGILGTPEALATLQKLLKDPHDSIRAQAVSALASAKTEKPVFEAAGDQSWRVRQKVAQSLAVFHDREAAYVADRLLDDRSAEVQQAAVAALDAWPLERSGPILLSAMSKSAFATRKAAAGQLTAKWPPAAEFPVEGPPERRAEVLKKLQQLFNSRPDAVKLASLSQPDQSAHGDKKPSAAHVAAVEKLLGEGNIKALADYGPSVVDALEQLHVDRKQLLPEPVYREVLPRYDPVFVVLDHLSSVDASQRRRAAEELIKLSGKQPFRRLEMARLAQLVAAEQDSLVWQNVLQAIADDGSQQAMELAYAALGHDSPEIRRRACEHLAQHPDPRHEQALIPALEDKHQDVVCAAARALAAAGTMTDARPLQRLLGSTNEEVQLEASWALARLGDPSGKSALERLAYSRDPKVRAKAAQAMGEFPDPAFTPILIHLLNDNLTVARKALDSLPKVVGKDVAQASDHAPATTTEQMLRWKHWHQRQSSP
ncbi:MAG TPA: HEAT repeat domain-containing protein [Thermoguttaceae bacterium]